MIALAELEDLVREELALRRLDYNRVVDCIFAGSEDGVWVIRFRDETADVEIVAREAGESVQALAAQIRRKLNVALP